MTGQRSITEKIALSVLAREGIAAIWALHTAAAEAYRTGHPDAAAAIVEIANAAEEAWLRANKRLRGRLADVIASLNQRA